MDKGEKPPALAAHGYESVVLVLQGGGALGAYRCGGYEGLPGVGVATHDIHR